MAALIAQIWDYLPAKLRKELDSYARARLGIAVYVGAIPAFLVYKAGSANFADFLKATFSLGYVTAVAVGLGLVVLTIGKGMELGRKTVRELAEMLPDERQRIEHVYGERGIADVIAPWVKRRPSLVRRTTSKVGGKFMRIIFPVGWRF